MLSTDARCTVIKLSGQCDMVNFVLNSVARAIGGSRSSCWYATTPDKYRCCALNRSWCKLKTCGAGCCVAVVSLFVCCCGDVGGGLWSVATCAASAPRPRPRRVGLVRRDCTWTVTMGVNHGGAWGTRPPRIWSGGTLIQIIPPDHHHHHFVY